MRDCSRSHVCGAIARPLTLWYEFFILMRNGTAKIAISLDQGLLASAERLRKTTGESRSALIVRSLRSLLAADERAAAAARYVEAYRAHPETVDDERDARALARRSLAALPWDEK
jgi:hypothetical protein